MEFGPESIVINCLGLGAEDLGKNDVSPKTGQLVIMKLPFKEPYSFNIHHENGERTYGIPRSPAEEDKYDFALGATYVFQGQNR